MRILASATLILMTASLAGADEADFDTVGAPSSNRIIVSLPKETVATCVISGSLRAGPHPINLIDDMDHDVQAACRQWNAHCIRPAYPYGFKNPRLASELGLDRYFIVDVPQDTDTNRMAHAFNRLNGIENAGVDMYGSRAALFPAGTTDFGNQYGMHNNGQQGGVLDADIDAPEAWEVHTGDFGTVTIAIIDSGVYNHLEFSGRLLSGISTVDSRCADDSSIFCLDDSFCPTGPCNLADTSADWADYAGHGTHVAGIAAASGLDEEGVAGVSWGAFVLPVRVINQFGTAMSATANGVIWAVDNGADICNMSLQFCGPTVGEPPTTLDYFETAIDYANASDVLVVAASGNEHRCGSGEGTISYPARFSNTMAVSSTDNQDAPVPSANYGIEVDVSAPGNEIYSTWSPLDIFDPVDYRYESGTSMAAPHVSGVAALLKSYQPDLTHAELRHRITNTTDVPDIPIEDPPFFMPWNPDKHGTGRINAYSALTRVTMMSEGTLVDARQPSQPDGTLATGVTSATLTFDGDTIDLIPEAFSIPEVVPPLGAPSVTGIITNNRAVDVLFDGPIAPDAWTTLAHDVSPKQVQLAHLPGDVDGNAATTTDDVSALLAALDGSAALPLRSTDLDRSESVSAADLIRHLDLLNGAEGYDVYLGATLPAP